MGYVSFRECIDKTISIFPFKGGGVLPFQLCFREGLMLPCRARIWAALVESEDLRKEVVLETQLWNWVVELTPLWPLTVKGSRGDIEPIKTQGR